MAYSRNKYRLGLLNCLPEGTTKIENRFCESLKEFLVKNNFVNYTGDFYLFREEKLTCIIAEFKNNQYIAIQILGYTTERENSIQTKDELFASWV